MTETYPTDLTVIQKILVKANLNENIPRLRKYDFFEVLNAIAYVVFHSKPTRATDAAYSPLSAKPRRQNCNV